MEAYAEYGAMGVIVLLFVGMIHFLRSTLMDKLSDGIGSLSTKIQSAREAKEDK